MKRLNKSSQLRNERLKIGLVFCENRNDAASLTNLALAIKPGLPRIDHCRKPLILMRDRRLAEARKKNSDQVAAVVRAKQVVAQVAFVIAHQDCDAVEPAHIKLAATITQELSSIGVDNIIAVAPAWETEAWWFLWPAAVAAVNSHWRRLTRTGNHGMLSNAKETLIRDLRAVRTRDYEESDSERVSYYVKHMGLLGQEVGTCNSFADFQRKISQLNV